MSGGLQWYKLHCSFITCKYVVTRIISVSNVLHLCLFLCFVQLKISFKSKPHINLMFTISRNINKHLMQTLFSETIPKHKRTLIKQLQKNITIINVKSQLLDIYIFRHN